jgi:hypothetical protein
LSPRCTQGSAVIRVRINDCFENFGGKSLGKSGGFEKEICCGLVIGVFGLSMEVFGLIPFNTTSISLLLPLPLESYSLFVSPFPSFSLLRCPPLSRRQDRQGSGIGMSV